MNYYLQEFIYMARNISGKLIIIGLIVWIASFFFTRSLPDNTLIVPELFEEPIQTETEDPIFTKETSENKYEIEPLYEYEISGLVVSSHNSSNWLDYYHQRWNDDLNVKDLCLIWGDNVKNNFYQRVKFTSGDYTCYYSYSGYKKGESFSHINLSNNHLLTVSPEIKNTLNTINIGDQVLLKGYLVNYSKNGYSRGTSTSRTDSGNGACETIFVTDVDILKESHILYRMIHVVAFNTFLYSLILFVLFTIIYPYKPVKPLKIKQKKDI